MKGCVSFIFWGVQLPNIISRTHQKLMSVLGSLKRDLWEQCNSNCCGPCIHDMVFFILQVSFDSSIEFPPSLKP